MFVSRPFCTYPATWCSSVGHLEWTINVTFDNVQHTADLDHDSPKSEDLDLYSADVIRVLLPFVPTKSRWDLWCRWWLWELNSSERLKMSRHIIRTQKAYYHVGDDLKHLLSTNLDLIPLVDNSYSGQRRTRQGYGWGYVSVPLKCKNVRLVVL